MKDCADVGKELGLEITPEFFPKECCSSCHEDRDDGYPMVEAIADAEVCCAIWRLYDDKQKEEAGASQETQA